MKKSIHDELVKIIVENTSSDENPVDLLMNIIPMSKEAAYRRLRGEIKFTLDEAVKISQVLKNSIRNLFDLYAESNQISFQIYNFDSLSINDTSQYLDMLNEMVLFFQYMTDSTHLPCIYTASTFIPHGFTFHYKMMSKFNLFKWIYQMRKHVPTLALRDIVVSKKVESVQMDFSRLFSRFESVLIFENDLLLPITKDIKYFFNMGLISQEEVKELKGELNAFIDQLEGYVKIGKNENGLSFSLYISEICFDASYIYIEREDGHQVFSVNLNGLNFLGTEDENICKFQKNWMKSLMRYSTLISKSGEFERIAFFKKQREILADL